MFRLVGLQILATAIVALLAGLIGGVPAAVSAALGGAAVCLPNGLFALRLAASARGGANVATFFVGEFVKLGSTVALLALIAWAWKDVVWLAMIAAIIVTLKSYLIALLLR